MHKYIFLLSVITVCAVSCGEIKIQDSSPGTTIEQCLNRTCYSRTGSWDINLCGRRLMDIQDIYFKIGSTEESNNCIVNTIRSYTKQFGAMDCNLDGIPSVVFNQVLSCALHVNTKNSGGRYKRSKVDITQTLNLNFNQIIEGNNNTAKQNITL